MHKPKVIVIEYETRERMKDLAKKSQAYDMFLNELFDSLEANRKG